MNPSRMTALVTGGARRIGRAIVEDLARNGFAVAIHAHRSTSEAFALAEDVVAHGGKALAVKADLLDLDQAGSLVDRAAAALGEPLRLVVNSASIFGDDSADRPDFALWDKHFTIHVKVPVLLASKLAAQLPDGQDGLVVNMIDQRVWRLTPRYFSYTLSKSALWTATQTLAQGLAPKVRVNAVGPGPTLPSARQEQADFDRQVEGLIMGRGPAPAEFGATIRYLWQARSVTGQMIALDGGQHLAWQTPDVTGIRE